MSNEKDGVKVAIRIRKLISRELKANETIKWKVHEQSIWETDRNESAYTFGIWGVLISVIGSSELFINPVFNFR